MMDHLSIAALCTDVAVIGLLGYGVLELNQWYRRQRASMSARELAEEEDDMWVL